MLQIPVSTWQIDQVEDCGNGYGWSIVYLQGQEVYELAVLKNGKICYHTDITDDVVRGTWSTMSYYIQEIKYL